MEQPPDDYRVLSNTTNDSGFPRQRTRMHFELAERRPFMSLYFHALATFVLGEEIEIVNSANERCARKGI
jgi:hypothetical protein